MKYTIIFFAFIATVLTSGASHAQVPSVRLTFSEAINQSGVSTGSVTYTGLEAPVPAQVFEAIIPAATEAGCFASRDFSTARAVSPDRASVAYDPAVGLYKLKWTAVRDKRDSCRVLLVRQSIGATDLAVWQSNYGAGGFAEAQATEEDAQRGDGSIRPIKYAISLNAWSSTATNISVKYPARDGEVVDVGFPAAANSNFRLFETSFAATSDAQCVANQDFSAAIPVGSDRATIGYFPSSGYWFLRNTNAQVPSESCRALIANGDDTVDADDYVLWRSRFGSSLFAEGDESWNENGETIDLDARQPGSGTPGGTVTFTFTVTNPG